MQVGASDLLFRPSSESSPTLPSSLHSETRCMAELLVYALVVCAALWTIWSLVRMRQPQVLLRSVAIVVLGDIGRSPRMMYHAESFASIGFETYLVGYTGESSRFCLANVAFNTFQARSLCRHFSPSPTSAFSTCPSRQDTYLHGPSSLRPLEKWCIRFSAS